MRRIRAKARHAEGARLSLVRLIQPDGVATYISPRLVVGIWLSCAEKIGPEGMASLVVVAWAMPSERDDRTHTGRLSIVMGTPDGVAKALGFGGEG